MVSLPDQAPERDSESKRTAKRCVGNSIWIWDLRERVSDECEDQSHEASDSEILRADHDAAPLKVPFSRMRVSQSRNSVAVSSFKRISYSLPS